jgi:hypothetical protein
MEPQYHQLDLDLRIFCVVMAMGENPYSWTVSGQRSAVSGQRSAVSGQRSAVSGQRSAVSGQRKINTT